MQHNHSLITAGDLIVLKDMWL